LKFKSFLSLAILLFLYVPITHAEENRARALSENNLGNMLMDMRMAKEDMLRSKRLDPIAMFDYERVEGDIDVLISNLEHFLYPRVKIKREAVPVVLDGRYFKEAVEESFIISPLPRSKVKTISMADLPEPPMGVPDGFTKKDLDALNDITRKDTVVVVREKEKVEKEIHTVETVQPIIQKAEVPAPVEKIVEKVVEEKKPESAAGVLYAWERNYNKKDTENMMKLYSEMFKGGNGKKTKRREDFIRDFIAFPDAVIRIYNLSASAPVGKDGKKLDGWNVSFDAEMSGKQWREYQHGNFIIDGDYKIIDETWSQAVPDDEDTGS